MKKKGARANGISRGVNPQEATIPEEHDEDLLDSPIRSKKVKDTSSLPKRHKKKKKKLKNGKSPDQGIDKMNGATPQRKKRKRRNRVAYMARMNGSSSSTTATPHTSSSDSSQELPSIPIPLTQYATTLSRRAIRKRESDSPPSPQAKLQQQQVQIEEEEKVDKTGLQEEYGDTSLGMKLSIIGGKVIVQRLNPLSDGRASPAQVGGVIQRGDVVLSIDNKSLVNLPIDLMMDRLKPLSTPDSSGAYQRILQLRMAAGAGLELLIKQEAAEARKAHAVSSEAATASEVFSLFPMADQLSGVPLFDMNHTPNYKHPSPQTPRRSQHQEEKKQTEEDPASPASTPPKKEDLTEEPSENQKVANQHQPSLDDIISSRVAQWRSSEQINFTSEYYAWNETYSELLRPSEGGGLATTTVPETKDRQLTKREMLELGRRALLGAENMSRAMESIDRGKDVRSFRSWNSSISLRSGAGTRRRYVLDAVSLPVKFDSRTASPKGPGAGVSLASGTTSGGDSEMDEVDGDALLLRLAAHDEIWRSQVIEALKNERDKLMDGTVSEDSEDEEDVAADDNKDDAIAKELGAFLFGETLAKVVTKKKKSKALPPEEITAVLFDLSTNLASTMPDEVAVGDGTNSGGLKSSLMPFMDRRNPEAGSSVILATRFVLDEALVVWLETFRPFPWESRRVLWPQAKASPAGDGHTRSMFSDNDSLTIDSGMSPTTAFTGTSSNLNHNKDLRQQIEDQELDVETRAETCFLVTYYFTQRLLPKLAPARTSDDGKATEELVAFIKKYGAYMKLHTSLAYAAALKCIGVIDELLELAQHDPRHREVMKLFSRRQSLILYEPTMLSAVVKCLPMIREEPSADRRQVLVDVCVTAYPDLCPWQVRQALVESPVTDKAKIGKLKNLYYYYLSSLLHPQDGHDGARHDAALVEEWCNLSLDASSLNEEPGANSRRRNFLSVASLNSSDHLGYHRDLAMLIKLSMSSQQYHLALDLANEIVNNQALARDKTILSLVLEFLRDIARNALDKGDQNETFRTLKRVVRLLQDMDMSLSSPEQFFSVAEELHGLLEYKERQRGSGKTLLELVHFLAHEAPLSDFLQAFNTFTVTHRWPHDTVAVLQSVLKRGTRVALNAELSGSLLRLRRARQRMKTSPTETGRISPSIYPPEPNMEEPSVWSLMKQGHVAIDK